MRKNVALKSSLLLAILFCFLPYQRLSSCGSGPTEEFMRFWTFQPDLIESTALLPFTYCANFEYTGSEWGSLAVEDTIFRHDEYDANVREWQQYTKSGIKSADIHAIMYETAPGKFFKNPKDSLSSNTFYAFAKQHDEVYRYLTYAKKCEARIAISPWEEYTEKLENPSDSLNNIKGIDEGEQLLKTCQDPFLKQRYAFQVIRQAQYFQEDRVAALYEANFKNPNIKSWVNGSTAYYYALTKKNVGERNYWLSKCFDAGVDKQQVCIRHFYKDSIQLSLPYATNDHEKAVQYAMKSLQYPAHGLDLLKQIYALDPSNKAIPMLLQREVNKLEDWLMTEQQSGYEPSSLFRSEDRYEMKQSEIDAYKSKRTKIDMAHLKAVRNFVDVLAASDNQANKKGFFKLSAAYLAFLNKDLAKAKAFINEVKTMPNLTPRLQVQTVITSSMIACYETPKLNEALKQEILNAHKVINKNAKSLFAVKVLESQLNRFWATQLLNKGYIVESFLMVSKTLLDFPYSSNPYTYLEHYAKPADYDYLIEIIKRPKKDQFYAYLTSKPKDFYRDYYYDDENTDGQYEDYSYSEYNELKQNPKTEKNIMRTWDINRILNYKATYYVRKDQLDSALTVFKAIPNEFWSYEPYSTYLKNPFYTNIYSNEFHLKDSTIYTKTSIIERMIALKKDVANNPETAAINNYYLGNAYYNICFNGNCWIMNSAWKSTSDINDEDDYDVLDAKNNKNPALTHYYNYSRAVPYYQAALKASQDDNLTAMCAFMLDVCKQKPLEKVYTPQKSYAHQLLGNNKAARSIYDKLWSDCDAYQAMRERIF